LTVRPAIPSVVMQQTVCPTHFLHISSVFPVVLGSVKAGLWKTRILSEQTKTLATTRKEGPSTSFRKIVFASWKFLCRTKGQLSTFILTVRCSTPLKSLIPSTVGTSLFLRGNPETLLES